ncbi:DUF4123 domain-containing protein [Pseudomonas sp. 21LCFQ02]|uniref:DUF4123 domain-containing protein n=1 Tax=unclassified Pseudomonas TaxID=196821 RepID=UPI0004F692AF|nr:MULTISPECIES: DUF4123 domain-containing protein [unclassified Pseudomonas]MCO8170001.1 DUF4123 domain-containing protein [Pseudomonas sp. 21LCFQ02]BAP40715.1 putative uncharacterized protein [Pseudomonas sp. StFLB209]
MRRSYLLLDSAQIDGLDQHLLQVGEFMACHPLYLNTAYAELADCGPLLVPVVAGSKLADLFHTQWRSRAGIWLETEASETELLDHLRSLVHVNLDGDVTVLFRYYDPRITRLWLADLQTFEQDRLMGPVQLIRLPDDDNNELLINRSETAADSQRYQPKPWLHLSAEQLDVLGQVQRQQFDQHLIDHCRRYFPFALAGMDTTAHRAWAKACRLSAARHGYGTDDQVTRWVSLYAHLGPDFPAAPAHQAYRQILEAPSSSPQQRLDALLEELTLQLTRTAQAKT